jgi:hypothetical protein
MAHKVVNISRGRVQILESGRVTRSGGHEVVPTITRGIARLEKVGVVEILPTTTGSVGLSTPAPAAAEPAPVAPPEPVVEEEPPAPEPVVEAKPKKKAKRAREEDGQFQADDPTTPDVNEAWEEESTDNGRSGEEQRLADLKYEDLKREASDAGISGRSRKALVASLLEQRFGAE